MKLGLQLFCRDSQLASFSKAVEDAGFDGAWIPSPTGFYAGLAHMIDATSRITIGSAIMPCLQAPPFVHALTAMFLQRISSGRFILGMGSQTKGQLRTQMGIDVQKPVKMAREVILITKAIMENTGARIQYAGEFFNINLPAGRYSETEARMTPPPIYYSGVNRLNLRLAGEISDGLVAHPIFPVRYFREVVWPTVDQGLKRAGKTRAAFDMCAMPMVWVAENESERREGYRRGKRNLASYWTTRAYGTFMDVLGWTDERLAIEEIVKRSPYGGPFDYDALESCIADAIVDEICLIGTAEEVRARAMERYIGLADTLILYVIGVGGAGGAGSGRDAAVHESEIKEEQLRRVLKAFSAS